MIEQSIASARTQIRRELLENEHVLWEGAPDRPILYGRLKWFVVRNMLFFAAIGAAIAAVVWLKPDYAKSIIILLGGLAFLRMIGCALVWPRMRKRWHMFYALTDRRLATVNGKTGEISSWFSPCIDKQQVKRARDTATVQLCDSELGVKTELYAIRGHEQVMHLLKPYLIGVEGPQIAPAATPPALETTSEAGASKDRLAA